MSATSRKRLLAALEGKTPDRLPVTTHHLMPSSLNGQMGGISSREFSDHFGLDAHAWAVPCGDRPGKTWLDPHGFTVTDHWRIESDPVSSRSCHATRWRIITPRGQLTTVIQGNEHTVWLGEPIVKQRSDIDLLGDFMPAPVARETFTPPAMGGDVNLTQAKRRIKHRVCMIGGFDQFHHFVGCDEAETRAAVRRCFHEACSGGGYILAPSDHFFHADLTLIVAYADEARRCTYDAGERSIN